MVAEDERPLRRDAERNRRRILHAAAEVFTERGLDATLDDVARRAGVGVGTVYRRFPDKEALIEVLFTDRIDAMVAVAKEACAAPDPWAAFVSFLEYVSATLARDLGLRQLMMFATYGRDRVAYGREQMRPVVSQLVARAQEAGALRSDFSPTDVPMIAFMLASVSEYASPVQPRLWERYLAMIIDALRPAREGMTQLPVAALRPEEIEQSMRAHAHRSAGRRLFRAVSGARSRTGPAGCAPRARQRSPHVHSHA
jgi:AcrR family transcriptional regulator